MGGGPNETEKKGASGSRARLRNVSTVDLLDAKGRLQAGATCLCGLDFVCAFEQANKRTVGHARDAPSFFLLPWSDATRCAGPTPPRLVSLANGRSGPFALAKSL